MAISKLNFSRRHLLEAAPVVTGGLAAANLATSAFAEGLAKLPSSTASPRKTLLNFFGKLPNSDRQFVMIPGATHAVGRGTNHQLRRHATRAFLSMPLRADDTEKA
jgi:hypothetical protein